MAILCLEAETVGADEVAVEVEVEVEVEVAEDELRANGAASAGGGVAAGPGAEVARTGVSAVVGRGTAAGEYGFFRGVDASSWTPASAAVDVLEVDKGESDDWTILSVETSE